MDDQEIAGGWWVGRIGSIYFQENKTICYKSVPKDLWELNNILWSIQHFPYSNLELHVLTKYVPEVQLFGIHYFKLWILKEGISVSVSLEGTDYVTTDMKINCFSIRRTRRQ